MTMMRTMQNRLSLLFHLIEPGSNLYPAEIIPAYACAFWFYIVKQATLLQVDTEQDWGTVLFNLAVTNATVQFALFIVVVQIPAYITGHMSNVDIAWPTGLVLLAVQALHYAQFESNVINGSGDKDGMFRNRTYLIGIALFIHGARMALGAFALFSPFNWTNGDLPRYQYAKTRWCASLPEAENLWWLKQQHETIMQAYINSVYIAAPILLVASNPNNSPLRPMEIIGFIFWITFWTLENLCDVQKIMFVEEAKKRGGIRTAVLGYTPYDTPQYWLWTKCRHPNYFFEWMCWNSFILMAIPSALDLVTEAATTTTTTSTSTSLINQQNYYLTGTKAGIFVIFFYASRMFYDCLLYWTGAEPAESRSVIRRPLFKRYQEKTNIFFPFNVPFFFNHHRTPGWPKTSTTQLNRVEDETKSKSM